MKIATGTSIDAQATRTMPIAHRHPSVTVSCAIAGTNTSWPALVAAPNAPMITPRCVRNQRWATAAPSTPPTAPVPSPMGSPQSTYICQRSRTKMSPRSPPTMRMSPTSITRRGPKRSMSVPPRGPPSPNVRMLSEIANEIAVLDQPNSDSSDVMITPGAARTACAASRARKVTATTTHA